MSRAPYTIGLLQMKMSRKPQENLDKAIAMLREAKAKGVQVACLPELFMGPYFCQSEDPAIFDLAEPIPGPTTEALGGVAKELGITILASLFERRFAGMYHNTLAVIYPTGELGGIYRKMHIPDDPLYYEKYYFTPGDLGFKTFTDTQGRKLGTLVCWDQWFPEAARLTAMQGAEVIFYPTAIGWHPAEKAKYGAAQSDAWETVQRGHAVANGVYVAACNRVGHEDGNGMSGRVERGANANTINGDGIEFFGGSFICDPQGQILAKASRDKEEIIAATIDPAHQETVRRHWPFFRDRRIEHYGKLMGHPENETIAAMRDSEEGRTEETTLDDLRQEMGLSKEIKQSVDKAAISQKATHIAYEQAKKFYRNEITLQDAVSQIPMHSGSAMDYIYNYQHMRKGEKYCRTMNAYTTRFFLQSILKDEGKKALEKALLALEQHIDYFNGLGYGKQRTNKTIYDEFSKAVL